VEGIQNYIRSLNWGYRVALKNANVTYLNEFAEFVNNHSIKVRYRYCIIWFVCNLGTTYGFS